MKKFVSIALFFSWLVAQEDVISLPSGARLDLPHTANVRVDTIMVKLGATFAAESPRDFSAAIATGNGTIITGQPLVSSVSSSTSDGAYNAGDTVLVTITFSENVTVTGTPQLTMETGSTDAVLNYVSGSGTATLVFRYIVASGHTSTDLSYGSTTALSLPNSDTKIQDNLVNDGVLTLPVPGATNSLAANKVLVIDTEAPTAGTVSDGSGTDVAYSGSSTSITANWTGFSDALSGIASYEIAVGTTSGATNILSWTSAGDVTTYTKSDLSLTHATRYYVSTRAQDAAGNYSSAATANGVIIDVVAPSSTVSIDSTTYNASEWDAATAITGTAADTNSGLSLVETSIQRSTDSYYWTGSEWSATEQWLSLTGTSTWNYAISSANLTDGTTYTVRSRGTDAVGNVQSSYGSDSFIYDISEPNTALSIANDYYNPAGWTADQPIQGTAADDYSGIAKVEVLIKRASDNKYWSSAGWTADSTWSTATGTATWQYTITADSLTDTETYTVRSRATDGSANLETTSGNDSFIFDSTLPASVVTISRDYYNNVNWSDVSSISGTTSDSTSGMSTVEITLQRATDFFYWSGTFWGPTQTWLSPNGLASWSYSIITFYLTDGTTYIVKSRGTDIAGNVQTSLGSDSFTYDLTAPVVGTVADGLTGTEQEWSSNLTTMSANWTGFSDALSGLASFEYSIGSEAGGTQVSGWTNIAQDTSMIDSSLTLLSGYQYFVNIRAIDQAENTSSVASSNGVNTDNIPPEVTAVYDGSATVDQEFQQDSTSMIVGWAATDSRELSYYSASLGTDTALVDIVAWTDVGSGSNYTFTGLSLQEGVSYYANVKAVDQAGNESVVYTTDGIIIDRTGPAVGTVNDGNSGDIDWVANNFLVTGNINDFSDALSGIAEYQYSLGITPGGTQSQPWTSNALDTAIIMLEFLVADVTYYLNVRAIDSVGNIGSYASSDGFGVDQTDPVAGNVYDGISQETEIEWTNNTRSVSANWSGFTDTYSGIDFYEYAIGTPTSDVGVVSWTSVDTNLSILKDGLNLVNGVLYHASVRSTDGVGNASLIARSNGFTIDTDDAMITSIIEGDQTTDWDYQPSDTSIILAWTGTDAASGVASYEYSIGTHPDSTNIVAWTGALLATDTTVTGLSLTEGTVTYYSSVRVTDAAGNLSQKYSGDGIIVDLTAPVTGTIIDGLTAELSYTGSNSVLSTSWQGFSDGISGINYYEYAIGSVAGGSDISDWTNIALDSAVTTTALNLSHANTYYHSVRGVDLVSNVSQAVTSDGITVDLSTPETGIVIDGLEVDQYWTNSTTDLVLSWSGFQDTTSGIANFQMSIGTVAGANNVLPWVDLDTVIATTQTGLSLVNGGTYFGNIKAVDGVGNIAATVSSNGVTVDAVAPVISSLIEADLNVDWDYQGSDSTFTIVWSGNDAASGIDYYEYALGTESGSADVVNWTIANLNTSVTIDSLFLEEDRETYYGSVRATDLADNTSAAFSGDGVEVDISPPSPGTVIDGTNDDLVFTGSDTALTATWEGYSDAISGIAYYEYAIGLSSGTDDVLSWVNNALDTTLFVSELVLDHATLYYQSVRAVDLVNNVSVAASSNGIMTDHSPPEEGVINDGIGADETWLVINDRLYLNWNSFQDTISGIQFYEYAIGTVPGQSNVVPWVNVGTDTSSVDSQLVLNHGVTYYGSVRVTDNVDNVSDPYSSDGITVDLFNPTVDIPVDGVLSGADLDYQTSSNSLTVYWLPTVEAELDYYEYSFSTTVGEEDIVPWTVTTDTMAVIDSLDLAHAQIYFANLRAFDLAGNPSFVSSSDGITVDLYQPTTGTIIDGLSEDETYTGALDTLFVTWTDFSDTVSGIQYFEYGVGTTSGGLDIRNWTDIGPVTTINAGALSLVDETSYYVSVKATDGVGHVSDVVTTNGITADHTGPAGTTISDGDSTDIDRQNDLNSFSGNWPSFTDEFSGLARHEVALYDLNSSAYIETWIDAGLDTVITFNGLDLVDGNTYEIHVRGVDVVGNTGAIVQSDGVLIDLSAPVVPIGLVGWFTTGRIFLEWTANTEMDLGLYSVYGGIENNPTDLLLTTTANTAEAFMPSYEDGTLYYLRITATDIPGNESDYTDEVIGIPQETAITSISPDTSIVYTANQNQLTIQLSQPVTDIGTVSSSSIAYPGGMQISMTYSAGDTTILIQFDEPFASLDTIDLVLSGMVDWSNNGTTDKYLTLHTYLLADYNSDNLINVIDLTDFATAWSANTLSFELGPVSGTVPHLIPVPNGKFDLRDVMAFTRMWHWYNQTPILSGGGLLASGSDIGPLLNIAQQDRNLVVSLPEGAAAGQVFVHYPPASKQFSTITDVTSEKQIYLSSRNQEAGQMLVEWADLGSENMAEVVLVAQSLDRNNTNVTVTYTIFDDNKEIISSGTQTVALKAIPDSYALHNNFPNPFNPVTNIFYDLPESGYVRMVIYDLLGREVTTLINETMKSGYYSTRWNGRNQYGQPVGAGIYFYHLQTSAYSKAQKMLLVK